MNMFFSAASISDPTLLVLIPSWISLFIGTGGPRRLRAPANAKVMDVCNHEGWSLADPRSEQSLALHAYLTTINLPSVSQSMDSYEWVVEDNSCKGFSTRKTWDALRPRAPLVDWHDSVWFKGAMPRHAFNMWIANLDRLPTKMRLVRWGMNINSTCDLCSLYQETRDHLFLACDYARSIWLATNSRLGLPQIYFTSWSDLISWTKVKNNRSPPTLRKLVAQSVIYAIWKQRNNLLHNQTCITPSILFKEIDREIRNSIIARQLKKRFKNLMGLWL
ncbi:PREDICTED: uncharacterized protein LOC104717843 isoform X2 [Camelina sativa]|uniref:Uncharacterized protein LOC104717843 isoform X2 n=1 Tax=Camelina sativa TaxID=90675 RepID=A0ABM0TZS9_CAMSA|nr:PREDICTED: uncharacterized protein LOC104717843 isoform X2 [Camelina sativa]